MSYTRRDIGFFLAGFARIPALHKYKTYKHVPRNLIISPGGVATTTLMFHCDKFMPLNSPEDLDELKHIPTIPDSVAPDTRIMFLYGDVEDIYQSIKRRGWLGIQGAKLGYPLCYLPWEQLQTYLFKHAVRRQIDYFLTCKSRDILSIRYDELWDRQEAIRAFFDIADDAFVRTFPTREARTTVKV